MRHIVAPFVLLGILAADGIFIGRSFFVSPVYADQSCEDSGFVSYCSDCPEDKTCDPVKGIKDICYTCRDKRRCEDLGFLSKSSCDNCAGKDPKMTCGPKGRDEDGKPCFECRPKRENEFDCAYYGMPSHCPSCQPSQICKPVKRQAGNAAITCYECQSRRSCRNQGLMTEEECPSCVRDPRMLCASIGTDDFKHECFECREKKEKEIDCAYYGMPNDCSACPPDKFCEPVKKEAAGNLITCYQYRDKRRCDAMGLLSKAECPTCIDTPTNICAPTGNDEFGEPCFECRKKKGKEIDCVYYGLMSQCSACSPDAKCEPVVKSTETGKITCYQCRNKLHCRDKGFIEKEECTACADDPHKKCVSRDNDDFGNACFECIEKKGKEIDCAYYKLQSQCSACPEGWKCEPVDRQAGDSKITCYECKAKQSCKDKELLTESECASCRENPDMMCAPQDKDDRGHPCFKCVKKQKCYDLGQLDQKACAACTRKDPSMACVETSRAQTGEQCYKCVKKTCDTYGLESKCSACGEGARCETVTKNDRGYTLTCYRCEKMRRCHDLGLINQEECASCIDNPEYMCASRGTSDTGTPCFECVKKEGSTIDCAYYGLPAKCDSCNKNNLCVPVTKAAGDKEITCYECKPKMNCAQLGLLTSDGCAQCIDDPSKICAPKGQDNFENTCYECRDKTPAEWCTYYLAFADCSSCKENENCVDAGLTDVKCYKCQPKTDTVPQPGPQPGPKPVDISRSSREVLIVVTCVQGRVLIKVYDGSGREVASIDKQSPQANGPALRDAIHQALGGGGQGGGAATATDSSTQQSNPGSVTALAPDITDAQIDAIADSLAASLKENRDCKKFCDTVRGAPGVDFIEQVFIRDVQKDETAVNPNDPFYFVSNEHKGMDIDFSADAIKAVGTSEKGSAGLSRQKNFSIHDQWGLHAVGFTPKSDPHSAWNLVNADEKNVVVAVIDSGLDVSHPDAPKFLWINPGETPDNGKDDDADGHIDDVHGWNFIEENNDLTDIKGHGTFVTGIIAACANNGIAIAGINPGAQVMVLKVGDKDGKATSANIYRALVYAADHGARVINISLASKERSLLEQRGIDYAHGKGCLIVVAAGNQSGDIALYGPPCAHGVISVSSADPSIRHIWSANTGANVSITAPGRDIYSLYSRDSLWTGPSAQKKNLCYKAEGTSFAAPFVTGTASLLLAKNPKLTNEDAENILLDTATDIEEKGWDQYTGAGFLNATAALSNTQQQILTARFMDIAISKEKEQLASVDIYGVVRGDGVRYVVELAKGTKSDKWEQVFESNAPPPPDGFLCRIDKGKVAGGKQWSLRLTAFDKKGNSKVVKVSFLLD